MVPSFIKTGSPCHLSSMKHSRMIPSVPAVLSFVRCLEICLLWYSMQKFLCGPPPFQNQINVFDTSLRWSGLPA